MRTRSPLSRLHASSTRAVLVLLLLAAAPAAASAQEVPVTAGEEASRVLSRGEELTVPVEVDPGALAEGLASLAVGLRWDASLVELVGAEAGSTGTVQLDDAGASDGELRVTFAAESGVVDPFVLVTLTLRAGEELGTGQLAIDPGEASDGAGTGVAGSLAPRALGLCVAEEGVFGDANADGAVNIIDAQLIARFALGLSVPDPAAVERAGDVNGDGRINVVDAQQVARFATGQDAPGRTGEPLADCDFPPSVRILSPAPGAVLEPAETTTLEGSAEDVEDGTLGSDAFEWTSDVDGPLGGGASVEVTDLTPGTHVLTLEATDSGGNTGSTRVTVTVQEEVSVTREQAIEIARAELVDDEAARCFVIGLAPQRPLSAGTVVREYLSLPDEPDLLVVERASWFVFVDLVPTHRWDHPVTYLLVDGETGEVTTEAAFGPPVIDGEARYVTTADRFDSPDRFEPASLDEVTNEVCPRSVEFEDEGGEDTGGTLSFGGGTGARPGASAGSGGTPLAARPVGELASVLRVSAGSGGKLVGVVVTGEPDFEKDSQDMEKLLEDAGGSVKVIDPRTTKPGDVLSEIRKQMEGLGPDDKFVLYVNTHGLLNDKDKDKKPDGGRINFLAYGDKIWGMDPNKKGSLTNILTEVEAGLVNLVVDACYSGSVLSWMQKPGTGDAFTPRPGTRVNVFVASAAEKTANGLRADSERAKKLKGVEGTYSENLLDFFSALVEDENGNGKIDRDEFEEGMIDAQGLLVAFMNQMPSAVTPFRGPPKAVIDQPADGAMSFRGEVVELGGRGIDEGETLPGSSLTWTSSLDGELGTGSVLSTASLSEGTHVITLTVTDADGNTGTTTIEFTVKPPAVEGRTIYRATDGDGRVSIYLHDLGTGERWDLTEGLPDGTEIGPPVVSETPDVRYAGFACGQSICGISIPPAGQPPSDPMIFEVPNVNPRYLTIGREGLYMFTAGIYAGGGYAIARVPFSGGSPEVIFQGDRMLGTIHAGPAAPMTRLAFEIYQSTTGSGVTQVATMYGDGTDFRIASPEGVQELSAWFGPGDELLYGVISGEGRSLLLRDDAGDETFLLDGPVWQYAWHPDGTRIVASREGAILAVGRDGTVRAELTDPSLRLEWPGVLANGNDVLVFVGEDPETGYGSLFSHREGTTIRHSNGEQRLDHVNLVNLVSF